MLINSLLQEEKSTFLDLVFFVATIDGTYHHAEQALLENYAQEMGLKSFDIHTSKNLDDLLKELDGSSLQSKRIILMELLAMALADGEYVERENEVISMCAHKLGLKDEMIDCIRLVDQYNLAMSDIMNYIYGGEL